MDTTVYYQTVNSTYEVDHENKRVRRIEGVADPTPHTGSDGVWKDFDQIDVSAAGLLIVWGIEDGVLQTTRTTQIIRTAHS